MDLSQKPLSRLILNPFGRTPRRLTLEEERIAARGAKEISVSFDDLSAPPSIRTGLLSATIALPLDGGKTLTLRGADKGKAVAFAAATEAAWRRFHISRLDQEAERISRILNRIAELNAPASYPSACKLQPLHLEAAEIHTRLLQKLRPEAIGEEQVARLAPIGNFLAGPSAMRNRAIDTFVAAELERWQEFFDTVESKPLTPEQRLSIVVDEDATLVLAGAGSGKTSVITAKAAYLLKAGLRSAEEILLLAFAKDAATEMSKRIEARCGAPIRARTFHALAYDIIGEVEGSKSALAGHATDDTSFLALIRDILKDLVATASEIARAIINWFAHFLVEPKDELDFRSKHDWYTHVEKLDLRSLQGEQVKSFEELQIANWLYENGIAYEYEPVYEHPLPGSGKRAYTPDFRLTESGVYLEHFGVRKERTRDGSERLVTAPFVNREEYLAAMEWKRGIHNEHGTILIETYSYEQREGRLLEALAEKLAPHVAPNPRPLATIYDRVIELGQVDGFSRMLGTFLRQFKSGGYQIEDCAQKAGRLQMGARARAFLAVFDPVSLSYRTIHASKGLEADHVILLGADSGRTGFPSEITDDPLLSLVSPEAEPFENAEERRVMYVAMTRARSTLTILASEARPSAFVRELLKDPAYGLAPAVTTDARPGTCGDCGGRLLPVTSQNGRVWYRCEHVRLCGKMLPACPSCGIGLPEHEDGASDLACSNCASRFPACPSCADGWLVPRTGRYGDFLGCVRYPVCSGKLRPSRKAARNSPPGSRDAIGPTKS